MNSLGTIRSRLFVPLLAGASLRDRLIACCGALFGISVTGVVCRELMPAGSPSPFLVAPMGASAVLVFAVPASPLAQPWPVLGGNVISACVGVAAARLIGDPALAAGVAVGVAILAMALLRCLHPPGGAAALTAVIGGPAVMSAGFAFPLLPIAINSLALLGAGWLFHRFSGHAYPHRMAVAGTNEATPSYQSGLHRQDIDSALADLGESFDISRSDLEALLQRAERHALERRAGREAGRRDGEG